MKVAFTSELKLTLDKAKKEAARQYPELKTGLKPIKTRAELELFLDDRDYVVYIEFDPEEDTKIFLAEQARVQSEVDVRLEAGYCEQVLEPIAFTQDDIDEDLCEIVREFPETPTVDLVELTEFERMLRDRIRSHDGGLSEGKGIDDLDPTSPIGKLMSCIDDMKRITRELDALLKREENIKDTLINFEELLYNYRVMEGYYQTKLDTLEGLMNTFTVPLREQRHIENVDLPKNKNDLEKALADLAEYILTNTDTLGEFIGNETVREQKREKRDQLQVQKEGFENRLVEIRGEIRIAKGGTWSFGFDNIQDGTIFEREEALENRINSAATKFGDPSVFSSNVELNRPRNSDVFKLEIKHEIVDAEGILLGRDISFARTGGTVTVQNYDSGDLSGVLYTNHYNIWGEVEEYFTRDERGLTQNSNQMDPTLDGTGIQAVEGNYIQNLSKYEDFYTNFPTRHDDKVKFVKSTMIEPALLAAQGALRTFAIKEVRLLMSFGKIFEVLPEDVEGQRLKNIIASIKWASGDYLKKLVACRATYDFVKGRHDQILLGIESKKKEYQTVECVASAPPPEVPANKPGKDPLGKTTMGKEDPNDPNHTKMCYWLKFAKYATAVNLLPLPGQGGFKYWPIGFLIPNPSGVIKIPLPTIWIPLAVISMPPGVFVVFIGLCGICPAPFVLYIGPDGAKKFIVSLRTTKQFGANAEVGSLKPLSQGGIAVDAEINKLLNGIGIPGFGMPKLPGDFKVMLDPDGPASILSDVREKIVRKVNKLELPDMSKIRNLKPNATIREKQDALGATVGGWLDGMKVPDINIPKDASKVNPKPPPVLEVMGQLKFSMDMDLPAIVPPADMVDLKGKLLVEIDALKMDGIDIQPITVPPLAGDPEKVKVFEGDARDALKKILDKSLDKITPKLLGMFAVTMGDAQFLNPYVCRQTTGSIRVPPIPPAVMAGIVTLKAASEGILAAFSARTLTDLANSLSGPGTVTIGKDLLKKILRSSVEISMPDVKVPNPSNLSIKDLMKSGMEMLASIQLPSMLDPSKPPSLRITIPGSVLKNAIKKATMTTLAAVDLAQLPDFSVLSAIDIKALAVGFVESSFRPIEGTLQPFLNIIGLLGKSQDKSFGEMLGLDKVKGDSSKVTIAPELSLIVALAVLKKLPPPPYPAVCVAPAVFKLLHPVLSQDDLPPWDRMSLSNFLFVVFLDQFCVQGKKGAGFYENP